MPISSKHVNLVRARAGLKTVEASWSQFSKSPSKYTNQDGLRAIIQQERLIELSFEASRFWDLRRWKRAIEEQNHIVMGWDIAGATPATYYRLKPLWTQSYQVRDYLVADLQKRSVDQSQTGSKPRLVNSLH